MRYGGGLFLGVWGSTAVGRRCALEFSGRNGVYRHGHASPCHRYSQGRILSSDTRYIRI